MELAKLLLKVLYIILVYVIIYIFLSSYDPKLGKNAMIIAFLLSVIIMYFTFNLVYDFLVSSELIISTKKKEEKTTKPAKDETENVKEEPEDDEVSNNTVLVNSNLKIDKKKIKNI